MTPERRDLLELAFNEVLLALIAYTLTLKALNIRRLSRLGAAIAANNLAFVLVYGSAALTLWVSFFSSDPWRYFLRAAVLATVLLVLIELKRAYGGWKELHLRAWASLKELVTRKPQEPLE